MTILYQPEQKPPLTKSIFYSLQFLAFNLINIAVVPLLIGNALGLDQMGIAELAQRTIFFTSVVTLLQAFFGHRLPILEGPAGTWWGIFIVLAGMAQSMGKDLALLRSDLELGLIIAGFILFLLGLSGLISKITHLFTPAVTGTVLILLTLQLSGSFLKGMLGITDTHPVIDPKSTLVSLIVIAVVILVNLTGQGFIKSIAILIGTVVGWLIAIPFGISSSVTWVDTKLIQLPQLFAWGAPTFDPGIVIVALLSGVLIISNLMAALFAMERTLGKKLPEKVFNRAITFTGISDLIIGIGATVGTVPFAASAGLVQITGVAARLPFIISALLMLSMGLLPPVSLFLSSIPSPVGYAVLLAAFSQMVGFGFKDYARLDLTSRQIYVIALPIAIGTGIYTLPPAIFSQLPTWLRYIVGNGFITGMILCLLLEHFLLPKRLFDKQD